MNVIVCYSKCWACMFGEHYEPAQWHSWADVDDIEHARDTGQDDPSTQRCGCPCANTEKETEA